MAEAKPNLPRIFDSIDFFEPVTELVGAKWNVDMKFSVVDVITELTIAFSRPHVTWIEINEMNYS